MVHEGAGRPAEGRSAPGSARVGEVLTRWRPAWSTRCCTSPTGCSPTRRPRGRRCRAGRVDRADAGRSGAHASDSGRALVAGPSSSSSSSSTRPARPARRRAWGSLPPHDTVDASDARPRDVVVHEHPRAPMDRRRSPRLKRGQVGRARVALVRVERPRRECSACSRMIRSRVTLARMLAAETTRHRGVGLDHTLDVGDMRRDEVPAPVDDRRVRRHRELVERSPGGQPLGGGHPELVTLGLGGVADAKRLAPPGDPVEEALAVALGEHLRIADAVQPSITGQHRGADRERAGPRPPSDLVDPDDDVVAAVPQLTLDRPRRGDPLRQRFGEPANGAVSGA